VLNQYFKNYVGVNYKDWDDVTTLTSSSWLNVEFKGPSGQECVFGCETHFHKWGKVQEMEPMTPKCTPILGIAFVWEFQMFKTLVEKENKHQIELSWSVNV
jgi:hypothetical protein